MYSYFAIPSSTATIITTVGEVLDTWGAGGLGHFTAMLVIAIFSFTVLIVFLRLFQK